MATERILLPPRVTEQKCYRGVIHQIYGLKKPMAPSELSELIATHRMVASHDGMFVAMIVNEDPQIEQIEHNLLDIPFPRFRLANQGDGQETRILDVGVDRLLVWGLPVGTLVCGVYEYTSTRKKPKLIHPFSTLRRVCRFQNGILLFGKESEDSVDEQAWSRFGALSVDGVVSATTVSDGSFLFLEQIEGIPYGYRVAANGFENLSVISCTQDEHPTLLVRVQNQQVLATRTQFSSRLRVVGSEDTLSFSLQEEWQGKIEYLWVSPRERSLAWLVRPDMTSSYRELYLNGVLIYRGSFSLNQEDLVWAQSGATFGVRITDEETGKQSIVSLQEETDLPAGTFLREFLIDADGKVAATISDNGELCSPRIYTRLFESVSLAWNLHWTPEGGIGYSSVLGSTVCRTTDSTELLRH